MNTIPYTVERRPDTGVNNVMLGMWLFLASEVMLFGGLFSAYVLLRSGAEHWPSGTLSVTHGATITLVLIASSVAMMMARRTSAAGDLIRARLLLHTTSGLAIVFVGLKVREWVAEIGHGMYPATSTFAALYFLLTGVHAVHVLGGLVANVYVVSAGGGAARVANRVAAAALYWYFIDLVWLIIFALLYLL